MSHFPDRTSSHPAVVLLQQQAAYEYACARWLRDADRKLYHAPLAAERCAADLSLAARRLMNIEP